MHLHTVYLSYRPVSRINNAPTAQVHSKIPTTLSQLQTKSAAASTVSVTPTLPHRAHCGVPLSKACRI